MKKKIKYLLFVLLTLIISLNGVNAATFSVGSKFTKSSDKTISISGLSAGGINYSTMYYHFSGTDGNNFTGYCMDPHKNGGTNYTVDRILGQEGSSVRVRAYDYGILEILKKGYSQINGSYSYTITTPESSPNSFSATLTGDELYAATSIAIRAYSLGLFGWGGDVTFSNGQRVAAAHINVGLSWSSFYPTATDAATGRNCKDSSVGALACYQNIVSSKYAWYKNYKDTKFTWGAYETVSYKVIYAAQQLFKIGVLKAADFVNNGIDEPNVALTMKNKESIERGEEQTTEYVYAEFAITNINDTNGRIKNVKYTCDTCAAKGISIDYMEYLSESGDWKRFNDDTENLDISKLVPKDEKGLRNGTLRIRLHITKTVKEGECSNASFKITYEYSDPNKEYIGGLLKAKNENDRQRFLIITKVTDTIKGEANGTITCASPVCETKISVPICSDNEDEAIATIEAPEKIKTCILDNVDDAGNNYQLTKTNGGVENDYCSVFCKEDYAEIKLNPVVENVVCGGYFQLKAHIQGSKDCYTGGDTTDKSIDKEQFLTDIIDAQKAMIEHYDKYLNYTKAKEHTGTKTWDCGSTCSGDCTDTVEYSTIVKGTDYTGYDINNPKNFHVNEETGEVSVISETRKHLDDHTGKSICSSQTTTKEPPCGEGGCTSCSTTSSTCDGGSESDLDLDNKIKNEKEAIYKAYVKFLNAINQYNACTTVWVNEYQFEQRLKYYYNEYHYEDVYEPYYSLLEKANNEELYYLEAQEETLEEEKTIEVCTGNTNEKYECLSGWKEITESESSTTGSYNYNSDYADVFNEYSFTVVKMGSVTSETKEGVVVSFDPSATPSISTPNIPISQATFVKKSVEKEQDYITPTAFYQIAANGKITVNSGYAGDALQLEALKNSLPVSTSTTGGGVFKLLLEDLGEFYDTGELGRLIDFEGDNEDKSVAQAQKENGIETFDGEYVCHYESPCPTGKCPNCEFTCEGEDCEWKECPDCIFDCINCIFAFDKLQLNFKTISTTNVTSANREYGYNWITNTSIGQLELISDKAELTIQEIEEVNDMVYDKTSDESGLAFSIKMTPEITNKIKSYNKSAEGKGGYANDSLTCYDAELNGTTYKNIYCYSDFIDELIEDYGDSITVYNRLDSSSNRSTGTDASGYWTLWDGYVYNESVIGGPSWK